MRREAGENKASLLFCFGDRVFPETKGRFFSLYFLPLFFARDGNLFGVTQNSSLTAAAQHVRADLLLTITRGNKFVQKKQTERNEYTVH